MNAKIPPTPRASNQVYDEAASFEKGDQARYPDPYLREKITTQLRHKELVWDLWGGILNRSECENRKVDKWIRKHWS